MEEVLSVAGGAPITVEYKASDITGTGNICAVRIKAVDKEAPTWQCPSPTVIPVLTTPGKASVSMAYGRGVDATSSRFLPSPTNIADNFNDNTRLFATVQRSSDGDGATQLAPYAMQSFSDGLTTVSYTASDAAGNVASGCDMSVLVVACPESVELSADAGSRYVCMLWRGDG